MWHVYGYMEGKEGNPRFPSRDLPVYGPLPRKRWVPDGKRYKVKHKVTKGSARTGSAKDYTEQRAGLYAEWLAQRDGLSIPKGCNTVAVWDYDADDKLRVRAVEWRVKKHARYGRATLGPALLTVAIPHWDWVPQATEEHDEALPLAA